MTLLLGCGMNSTLEELISQCIKEHNTIQGDVDNWALAVVQKTKADAPADCGTKLTFEEKLKQAISINCADNIVALNVVIEQCSCLSCGDELPCNTADLPLADKLKQAMCYTTDNEWAFYFIDITDRT